MEIFPDRLPEDQVSLRIPLQKKIPVLLLQDSTADLSPGRIGKALQVDPARGKIHFHFFRKELLPGIFLFHAGGQLSFLIRSGNGRPRHRRKNSVQ